MANFESAWQALSEPLSWMHDNPKLKGYWGWNLADIANDLIDKAYPNLRGNTLFKNMANAPKDGTMIRLLVDYTDGDAPLEDEHPRSWTIGFNNFQNTGEDHWQFAGWSWTHDHFCEGSGTPVGWLPWSNPSAGGNK